MVSIQVTQSPFSKNLIFKNNFPVKDRNFISFFLKIPEILASISKNVERNIAMFFLIY